MDNGHNQRTQRLPAMLVLENEYEIPEFSYERKERTVEGAKKSPACRSARRRNNIYGERNGKRQSCDFWSGSREHTNKTHRNYRQNTKRCESCTALQKYDGCEVAAVQVEQNGIAGQRKSFRHSSDTVVLGSAMLANNEIEPSNPLQTSDERFNECKTVARHYRISHRRMPGSAVSSTRLKMYAIAHHQRFKTLWAEGSWSVILKRGQTSSHRVGEVRKDASRRNGKCCGCRFRQGDRNRCRGETRTPATVRFVERLADSIVPTILAHEEMRRSQSSSYM